MKKYLRCDASGCNNLIEVDSGYRDKGKVYCFNCNMLLSNYRYRAERDRERHRQNRSTAGRNHHPTPTNTAVPRSTVEPRISDATVSVWNNSWNIPT